MRLQTFYCTSIQLLAKLFGSPKTNSNKSGKQARCPECEGLLVTTRRSICLGKSLKNNNPLLARERSAACGHQGDWDFPMPRASSTTRILTS